MVLTCFTPRLNPARMQCGWKNFCILCYPSQALITDIQLSWKRITTAGLCANHPSSAFPPGNPILVLRTRGLWLCGQTLYQQNYTISPHNYFVDCFRCHYSGPSPVYDEDKWYIAPYAYLLLETWNYEIPEPFHVGRSIPPLCQCQEQSTPLPVSHCLTPTDSLMITGAMDEPSKILQLESIFLLKVCMQFLKVLNDISIR